MKKFKILLLSTIIYLPSLFTSNFVFADEPYLGEMVYFAGNFAPRGWALCDGQLLQISQNQSLYSLRKSVV